MFAPGPADALRSFGGIWKSFTGYSGLPGPALIGMCLIWIAAIVRAGNRIVSQALARVVLLGPPIMIALFLATSPYAEVRFVYPAVLLSFVMIAFVPFTLHVSIIVALLMIGTSFVPRSLRIMLEPGLIAITVIALVICAMEFRSIALAALLALVAAAGAYVYWLPYSNQYRDEATRYWELSYGPLAAAWRFVRDEVSADATVAYANTHFVHPLLGAKLDRRVVYAPTRRGVRSMHDLGRLDGRVAGERIVERVRELTVRDADRETWVQNLRSSGARYVFIAKPQAAGEVPELRSAQENETFRKVFENSAAVVFEKVR
jgi:hypothetical protein